MIAECGSISTGTLRTADLLSAMLETLETLDKDKYNEFVDLLETDCNVSQDDIGHYARTVSSDIYETCRGGGDRETLSYIVNEELPDALQDFAPPGFYFGSHPGDGADIGFWLDEELVDCIYQYVQRRTWKEDPAGLYDTAGRWHPDKNERQNCCIAIREPSRKYRTSLLAHCRSLRHVSQLHNLDFETVREVYQYCKTHNLLDF